MVALARDDDNNPIQALSFGVDWNITATTTAQHSDPMTAFSVVRICTKTDIRVAIGVDAVSGQDQTLMLANTTEYVRVDRDERVSIIRDTNSTDGVVCVTTTA